MLFKTSLNIKVLIARTNTALHPPKTAKTLDASSLNKDVNKKNNEIKKIEPLNNAHSVIFNDDRKNPNGANAKAKIPKTPT